MKINETYLKNMIASVLREWTEEDEFDADMIEQQFHDYLGDRTNIIQFPNGAYIYVDYDKNRNVFIAGDATNAGIIEDVVVPFNGDIQHTMEELYDAVLEKHPELDSDGSEADEIAGLDGVMESKDAQREVQYIIKECVRLINEK